MSSAVRASTDSPSRPSRPHERTVLVADDDAATRATLQSLLAGDGWEVDVACDGIEAIAALERRRPSLVLVDVALPRIDGPGVARHVRAGEDGSLLPIVFLIDRAPTDLADEETLARGLDAGGDDFLAKPLSAALLRAKLAAVARARTLHLALLDQRDELVRLNASHGREQEIAQRVMQSVLHRGRDADQNVRSLVVPATLFSGDLLLTARAPDGNLRVLLGDFTGHGLQAAIGAIPVADAFRSMAEKGFTVGEIAEEINRKLVRLLPTGLFLATCLAAVDLDLRRVTVWNGGIPDALLFRPGRGIVARFASRHLPLAIAPAGAFDRSVQVEELGADDRLVLFSDGLIEVRDRDGKPFGAARLEALLTKDVAGEELFESVRTAVDSFRQAVPADDDLTLGVVHAAAPPAELDAAAAEVDATTVPLPWHLSLRLDAHALRHTDPLPLLLQALTEIQGFQRMRSSVYLVLQELYSNALDHGVLGLRSTKKDEPAGFDHYLRERTERLRALHSGFVAFEIRHEPLPDGGRLHIRIVDSGDGFPFEEFAAPTCPPPPRLFGRGLALVHSVCERVTWSGRGNVVDAVVRWHDRPNDRTNDLLDGPA